MLRPQGNQTFITIKGVVSEDRGRDRCNGELIKPKGRSILGDGLSGLRDGLENSGRSFWRHLSKISWESHVKRLQIC